MSSEALCGKQEKEKAGAGGALRGASYHPGGGKKSGLLG
jgi:hypothetical protein